jgi:hypothetical protein
MNLQTSINKTVNTLGYCVNLVSMTDKKVVTTLRVCSK